MDVSARGARDASEGDTDSGETTVPRKGVTRTGEAYCLECMTEVDPDVHRCPSCDFVFDQEVKVFSCPRCRSILVLGTHECPQCGMRFKIKALKHEEEPQTDEEGSSVSGPEDEETPATASPSEGTAAPAEVPRASREQMDKLNELIGNMEALARDRQELLSRMDARLSEEKERLSELSESSADAPRMDVVEAEVLALADEMEDLMNLHSSMLSVSDEISTLVDSFDLGAEAKERGLAAKAVRKRLG